MSCLNKKDSSNIIVWVLLLIIICGFSKCGSSCGLNLNCNTSCNKKSKHHKHSSCDPCCNPSMSLGSLCSLFGGSNLIFILIIVAILFCCKDDTDSCCDPCDPCATDLISSN